jgi:hypothetical protein
MFTILSISLMILIVSPVFAICYLTVETLLKITMICDIEGNDDEQH